MNEEELEEANDLNNPFKIMRNKIVIDRLIENNHDEVFVDQINHLRQIRKDQNYFKKAT